MNIGADVTQTNQWFGVGIINHNTRGRCGMRGENFLRCFRNKSDHGRRLQIKLADFARAFNADPTSHD